MATVSTRRAEDDWRGTHVWWAEHEGALWLEAGAPENPWFRDVSAHPVVHLTRGEASERFIAHPVDDPAVRAALRARLREKYGWRDRWVGLWVDASRSIPVRLEPAPREGRGPG